LKLSTSYLSTSTSFTRLSSEIVFCGTSTLKMMIASTVFFVINTSKECNTFIARIISLCFVVSASKKTTLTSDALS